MRRSIIIPIVGLALSGSGCGRDARSRSTVAPPRTTDPTVPVQDTCERCMPEADGGCASHTVSPCRWVLDALKDPIDIVTACEPACCPDRAAPELCPEFSLDATAATGALCPARQPDGAVRGAVAWRDPVPVVFVLAQAPGLVTTASEHSALSGAGGVWTMRDLPAGEIVFSFYASGQRTRVTCPLPP